MTDDAVQAVRAENRELMTTLLGRLGSQDFRGACALLAEDVLCDWPYPPMEGAAREIRGRAQVQEFFAGGMVAFEPYRYEITSIFDLVDPNSLIAEYHSNSRFLPSGAPYRNDYLGIFRFDAGLVTYWREYINPVVVAEVLATAEQS